MRIRGLAVLVADARRKTAVNAMILVQTKADLSQVIRALRSIGRRSHLLHRRHEQGDEHSDDGDDDQKLKESESRARNPASRHLPLSAIETDFGRPNHVLPFEIGTKRGFENRRFIFPEWPTKSALTPTGRNGRCQSNYIEHVHWFDPGWFHGPL